MSTSLLIDFGNSRLKLARCDTHGQLEPGPTFDSEALAGTGDSDALSSLRQWLSSAPTARCLGVCVADPAVRAGLERLMTDSGLPPPAWQMAQATLLGLSNGYREPAQLGADRWMAAVGGWAQRQHVTTPGLLLVHAGTATTVDALDLVNGRFLGGLILPGLMLMKQSLVNATALLRQTSGPAQDIPDNTASAIHTGCLRAQTGAIRAQANRLTAIVQGPVTVWLAGGAATTLYESLQDPPEGWPANWPLASRDNLVISGLAALAAHADELSCER